MHGQAWTAFDLHQEVIYCFVAKWHPMIPGLLAPTVLTGKFARNHETTVDDYPGAY
jgi:hypothetical protein